MREDPQAPETVKSDGDLRTRMEGRFERVEAGIHLLELATNAVNSPAIDEDEIILLRDVVEQLPRWEETLDELKKHDGAAELTVTFSRRALALQSAVQVRLKLETLPTLRDGLEKIIRQAQYAARPPRDGETRLMHGSPSSRALILVAAIFIGVAPAAFLSKPEALLLTPLVYFIATRLPRERRNWTLLPDRLHVIEGGRGHDVHFSAIDALTAKKDLVAIGHNKDSKVITVDQPQRLLSWLQLLRSQWVANLTSRPRASVLSPARERATSREGLALILTEGVFFLPSDRLGLALKAITPFALPEPPEPRQFLELLTHIPEGRWNALGNHLATACDGRWVNIADASVDASNSESVVLNDAIEMTGARDVILTLLQQPRKA